MPLPHAADRLLEAIELRGSPVCVGLDPVLERLPLPLRSELGLAERDDPTRAGPIAAIEQFCLGVIDAVAGVVPCVKPQSACFERFGALGVAALERVVAAADGAGLEVVLDAKRGDIGVSAEHYAEAAFAGAADWVTVNSYLGEDGIRPFLKPGRGAFALVRTSNPGGDALQRLRLDDGGSVAEAVAGLVARIGSASVGDSGFSALGAVVGATKPADAEALRQLMPQQLFLVPGYGAQGAGAKEIRPCFDRSGRGAIVNASRSVIFAGGDRRDWKDAVRAAAQGFAREVAEAVAT